MSNKAQTLTLLSIILLAISSMVPLLVSAKQEPENLLIMELRGHQRVVANAKPPQDNANTNTNYALLGVSWQTTAEYWVNTNNNYGFSPSAVEYVIALSANTWDSETSADVFLYKGTTTKSAGKRDGFNVIGWTKYRASAIAVAYIWYSGSQILESDMSLNTFYMWSLSGETAKMDVQNIVTHEFGHWAGLADLYSDADYWLTMYGYAGYGETCKRTLGLGDKLGLQAVYGSVRTPDFSIFASANTLTIPPGGSGTSTITVTSLNGFVGTVSLAADPPVWATLNPVSIAGEGTALLTITVPLGTATGIYTITVTGTSGPLRHSIPITVKVQTAPSAPQNLKAIAGEAKVTLSWSAPSDSGGSPITNYKIYKAAASGQETYLATIGAVLTYTDTAVTAGQTYYYQVAAVNSVGESTKSNEASATPSGSVVKTLSVTVETVQLTYSRRSTVIAMVTVTDNTNNPIQGATVRVTIYSQLGWAVWGGSGRTNSKGQVQLSYRLDARAQTGTYKIVAVASFRGYQAGTGQTTFNVV